MKFRKKPVIVEATRIQHDIDIDTLEGKMHGSPGDWLIIGVEGEMYPCKDSIFRQTYEPVVADADAVNVFKETGLTDIDLALHASADARDNRKPISRSIEAAVPLALAEAPAKVERDFRDYYTVGKDGYTTFDATKFHASEPSVRINPRTGRTRLDPRIDVPVDSFPHECSQTAEDPDYDE